eukprot:SAG31_NODE_741_length_12429_cov_13.571127_8_plen_83_part_00
MFIITRTDTNTTTHLLIHVNDIDVISDSADDVSAIFAVLKLASRSPGAIPISCWACDANSVKIMYCIIAFRFKSTQGHEEST